MFLGIVAGTLALLKRPFRSRRLRELLRLQQERSLFGQRAERLMAEANDIIFVLDAEGRILEANARALEQYSFSVEEFQGMGYLDLRPPEAREGGRGQLERLISSGALRFETIHQRKDGSTFPVEVSSRAVEMEGGQQLVAFVRDISERVGKDHELQRMTNLYAALSQVSQTVVRSDTRQALFDRICEVMVQFGRFDMAWIGWSEPTGRVLVAARHGDGHGYLDRIQVEIGDSPRGRGPVGMAIQQACPCILNDFLNEAGTEPWRLAARDANFASVAAFPIRLGGAVVGALAVHAREKDFFGPHEAALLEETSNEISYALEHLAGEERRRQAELALQESEQFLHQAQHSGRIGTYTWNIQENRWKSSAFLDEILGIDADYQRDLESWTALVAPDFRERMQTYVASIIGRHERFDLQYPIVRVSDGARRWVHGQGELHWDPEGRLLALAGTIQDITERKQDEDALRKISMAMEQSPLALLITDAKGSIEYVNPAFTQVTGYSSAEVIGQNPRLLKSPATPPEHYRQMWKTIARGQVWTGEFENLKKNGETFVARTVIAAVHDDAGVLTGYISLGEDITRARQELAERSLLESQLQQVQKLESLGSLAGGVAHDMNNVLGAILSMSSTLREEADPFAGTAKRLDTIINACLRGRGVVKSLLYFARQDLQEEKFIDLNALIRETTELLSHTMLQRVQTKLDLQEDLGRVKADGGALSHALMNLCLNAMDAMPRGGTIFIETHGEADGGVLLRVRDTGEGMAPEVLAKAMEPFYTTKPQGKGTGLGLAMVFGTMKAHEGRFDLLSQPGQGTEALLRFPTARVNSGSRSKAKAKAVEARPAGPTGLRILLVDDDELIRESVAPMLEMLGQQVTTAPGGAEALTIVASGVPLDLVILDMNMPFMSGAEVLPRLLALRPELAVIVATGYSDQEIAPLLAGRPQVACLRKPFSLKEVQAKLAEMGLKGLADKGPGAS